MTVPKSFDAQRTNAKMLPGVKLDDAAAAIEDLLLGTPAEAQPVLDLLLDPGQFDMGECDGAPMRWRHDTRRRRLVVVHEGSPGSAGNSRASRSRSMSATVIAALEGGDLDAAAQRRRDVDRQPRGEGGRARSPRRLEASGALIQLSASPGRAAKPRFGRRPRSWRDPRDFGGERGDLARRGALLVESRTTRRPDCAASAKTTRWPMVLASTGGS